MRVYLKSYSSEKCLTGSEESSSQYFYHSDHLGSAQLVTNQDGEVYQRIEYTPYGETWIDMRTNITALYDVPYRFTAKELDKETGLYYYGARYLDPKYSRWISADPAMNTGEYFPVAPVDDNAKRHNQNLPGMGGVFNHINCNLYHYAGNNPVRYIDPDGRFLIKTENAEKVALSNKSFLFSIQAYMEPMAIANDGRIWNINLLPNRSIPLSKDLDKAIDNVKRERANPSPYTKAMIIATCKKLDNDIYKINIIAAILIETPDGLIISSNNPETVAYATAAEVGISKFHSTPDQHKVNEIANKVLSYTNKGVTVDE